MATDIENVPACPLCESLEQDEVAREHDQLFPTGTLHLARCRSCGLVFLNPRLTHDAMVRLENESSVYELDEDALDAQIEARVHMLRSFPTTASEGRMLDIGCNRGLLLRAAKRLGWSSVGVEVSPVAAERARDAACVAVYPDLSSVPHDATFDLIVAWHVLEHTTDPRELLVGARKLLSADGLLALQVPSYDFLERFREQGQLANLVCAVHNLYFSERVLDEALARAGFARRTLINSETDYMLTAFVGIPRRSYLARRAIARLAHRG
jgi:SAM-dependent methyltransferase